MVKNPILSQIETQNKNENNDYKDCNNFYLNQELNLAPYYLRKGIELNT